MLSDSGANLLVGGQGEHCRGTRTVTAVFNREKTFKDVKWDNGQIFLLASKDGQILL